MASPFAAYFAGIGTVVAALAVGFGGGLFLTSPSPSQKEQRSAYEKRVDARFDSKPEKLTEPVNREPSNPNPSIPASPIITSALAPNVSTSFGSPVAPAPWPPAVQSTAQDTPKLAPDPGALQPPVRPVAPVEAATPAPPAAAAPPARAIAVAPPAQLVAPAPSAQPVANAPAAQAVAPAPPAQPTTKSRPVESRGQRAIHPREQRVVEPGVQSSPGDWKQQQKRDAFAQKKTQRKQIVVEQVRPEPADEDLAETRAITTYAPEPRPPLGIFNMLLGGGN
jgi:hypothetical protein